MKRVTLIALTLCAVLPAVAALADDDSDDNTSALVKLAPLQHGSLPIILTTFGKTEPSGAARETVTAPVASQVTDIRVQMGERIAKGARLLTLLPGPETSAAFTEAQQDLRLASQLVDRDQSMVKAHLLTGAELAKAENDLEAAKSKLSVLTEEGASGPNTLKAPFDAIVIKNDAASGALVSRGDALIELARPNGLVVEAGIEPAQAFSVKAGEAVELAPLSGGATVDGKVALRSEVVDSSNGLVPVEITFPPGKLLVGETVRAAITVGENTGFVVPHEAVLVDDDDGSNYIVQAVKMKAKKVTVKVLGSYGDKDVVDGKLDPKNQIVLSGNHQVDDGDQLRVAAAGADASGDSK
jgi:RND family efflux transporter MFP subunit